MASLPVDNQTAEMVLARASAEGISVDALLQRLLAPKPGAISEPDRLTFEEFRALAEELSTDGPSLPADFSRADIYIDHD
jgi:hypothetical protein